MSEPLASLPVVMFRQDSSYFAVEAADVRSQSSVLHCDRTQSASSFIRLLEPHADDSRLSKSYLQLAGPCGDWWLGLQEPAALIKLAAADIYALPPLLKVHSHVLALRALAFYQGDIVNLLDARALQGLRAQGLACR